MRLLSNDQDASAVVQTVPAGGRRDYDMGNDDEMKERLTMSNSDASCLA